MTDLDELRKQFVEHELSECKHFNGTQNSVCKAGVKYSTVQGLSVLPCLVRYEAPELCAKFELRTQEEAEHEADERMRMIEERLATIAEGRCTTCKKKVEGRRKVGRCLYAEPCGHRIGQA